MIPMRLMKRMVMMTGLAGNLNLPADVSGGVEIHCRSGEGSDQDDN